MELTHLTPFGSSTFSQITSNAPGLRRIHSSTLRSMPNLMRHQNRSQILQTMMISGNSIPYKEIPVILPLRRHGRNTKTVYIANQCQHTSLNRALKDSMLHWHTKQMQKESQSRAALFEMRSSFGHSFALDSVGVRYFSATTRGQGHSRDT